MRWEWGRGYRQHQTWKAHCMGTSRCNRGKGYNWNQAGCKHLSSETARGLGRAAQGQSIGDGAGSACVSGVWHEQRGRGPPRYPQLGAACTQSIAACDKCLPWCGSIAGRLMTGVHWTAAALQAHPQVQDRRGSSASACQELQSDQCSHCPWHGSPPVSVCRTPSASGEGLRLTSQVPQKSRCHGGSLSLYHITAASSSKAEGRRDRQSAVLKQHR